MEILRTIIRFLIIAIAIGILIFLSITLFKLIPKGINQLATATVSLGDKQPIASTTISTTTAPGLVVPVNTASTNGVYTSQGDIIILDTKSKTPTVPKASPVTTTVKKPTRYTAPTYTYYPTAPALTGRKNLRAQYSTMGIIKNGQFVTTNTFNANDTISVRFFVINEQDTPTGTWSMRIEMPTIEAEDRVKILTNLNSIPGESSYSVEARFSGVELSQGTPYVRIYLDTNNQVNEANENDNTLAITLNNVSRDYYNTYPNNYVCTNPYDYNCNYNSSDYYNNTQNNSTQYNGTPNLSIVSFETGRILGGTFYPQTTINYGERLAIRARVRNIGSTFSTSWSNKVSYSDYNNYTRDVSTGYQSGLSAGSETTITYELDTLPRGSNRITFTADTENNITESNESDNMTQVYIQVN